MNTEASTPTTARQALDQFEASTNPRAKTHIQFRHDADGNAIVVARRAAQTITLGFISGETGHWIAMDLLCGPQIGWTFARKTRTEAVAALLAGEGCVKSSRIIRSDLSIDLHVGGHRQASAFYSADRHGWYVQQTGTIAATAERVTSRTAAIEALAVLASSRYGVDAEVI